LISRLAFGVGAVSLLALAAGISVRWVGDLQARRTRVALVNERAEQLSKQN
jgi:hypothetical protein